MDCIIDYGLYNVYTTRWYQVSSIELNDRLSLCLTARVLKLNVCEYLVVRPLNLPTIQENIVKTIFKRCKKKPANNRNGSLFMTIKSKAINENILLLYAVASNSGKAVRNRNDDDDDAMVMVKIRHCTYFPIAHSWRDNWTRGLYFGHGIRCRSFICIYFVEPIVKHTNMRTNTHHYNELRNA